MSQSIPLEKLLPRAISASSYYQIGEFARDRAIEAGKLQTHYGLLVSAPITLADDPTGDHLDALLCAIQAAWAWTKRGQHFGELEGWIAEPIPNQLSTNRAQAGH